MPISSSISAKITFLQFLQLQNLYLVKVEKRERNYEKYFTNPDEEEIEKEDMLAEQKKKQQMEAGTACNCTCS